MWTELVLATVILVQFAEAQINTNFALPSFTRADDGNKLIQVTQLIPIKLPIFQISGQNKVHKCLLVQNVKFVILVDIRDISTIQDVISEP